MADMQTTIGRNLQNSGGKLAVASVVGITAVAADLTLVKLWNDYSAVLQGRWVIALAVLVAYLHLAGGDLKAVGLMASPRQGWKHWVKMTVLIGLAVGGCIVVGLGAWWLAGGKIPIYTTSPRWLGVSFLQVCVFAPVLEEALYRFALCIPLAVLLRPWGAVAVSGLVFGGLHVLCGVPSPENLVGGFFLAWAYLKSETIYVPLLLHSLGNFCALALQVGAWYWFGGAA